MTLRGKTGAELLKAAQVIAGQLRTVVKQQGWSVRVRGGEHLRVEAWTCLAALLNLCVREAESQRLENGWASRVEVVCLESGQVVGSAWAMCTRDEKRGDKEPWRDAPEFALRSMAQTRATGKAIRMGFGWIANLAGFDATPAEEIEYVAFRGAQHGAAGGQPKVTQLTEEQMELGKLIKSKVRELMPAASERDVRESCRTILLRLAGTSELWRVEPERAKELADQIRAIEPEVLGDVLVGEVAEEEHEPEPEPVE